MTLGVCALDKVHLLPRMRAAFADPQEEAGAAAVTHGADKPLRTFLRSHVSTGQTWAPAWIWMRADEWMDLDVWSNHNHPQRTHLFIPFHKL